MATRSRTPLQCDSDMASSKLQGVTSSDRRYSTGPRRLTQFDYSDPDATYFVTICVHRREPVFAEAAFARPVVDCLHWLRANQGVIIYALCLMPDHLHPLIRPGRSLGDVVRGLKTYTTRQVQAAGRSGKLWQDDYYEHILRTSEDGWEIAQYIMHNPVRKGLAEAVEAYPMVPDSRSHVARSSGRRDSLAAPPATDPTVTLSAMASSAHAPAPAAIPLR